MLGKVGLPLVEIAGQKVHRQEAPPLEIEQQRQHAIAVLAAAERHQPLFTRPRHGEFVDCLARIADQALAQLVELHRARRMGKDRMGTGVGVVVRLGGGFHHRGHGETLIGTFA
ncbi:hypothetical protein D9M68_917280 [compost metagenome]